jgi:Family of unknown function (DUF5985)
MNAFLLGAVAISYGLAGLFFLRYWQRSRDRLFALFAVAFWILAANRTAFALLDDGSELSSYLYVVRLVAFLVVLVAIVDKNRSEG